MIIGVPKEIKNQEMRAALTPLHAQELIKSGHEVIVESSLGIGINESDESYLHSGVKVVKTPEEVFKNSDMILKVKEPLNHEIKMLKSNQILFCYLHLSASKSLTQGLLDSGCSAIAYETVTGDTEKLPLLSPMSAVAGRLSIQVGLQYLLTSLKNTSNHCKGILLGGLPGTPRGRVVLIGGGVVGQNAAEMAVGLGANVTVLDTSLPVLKLFDQTYKNKINTLYANQANILSSISNADLVVSSVLLPGSKAPKLITKNMLSKMEPYSVLVDVAIDQGGSTETSKPTTHDDPIYVVDNIIHYCVTNMPGISPKTSSLGLNNAVIPLALEVASQGLVNALSNNRHLKNGLNVHKGKLTNNMVAKSLNMKYEIVNF